MSYRTILVHVDTSKHTQRRIEVAAEIAAQENAHLIGAAVSGVSDHLYQGSALTQMDPKMAEHLAAQMDILRERARKASEDFMRIAARKQLRSYECPVIDDEAGAGLTLRARYSDLTVITQTDPDEPAATAMPGFQEYVVLNSGRPVLVLPYAFASGPIGKRVLVSWDGGVAATRAIADSLPLLRRADSVEVVVFNADKRPNVHGEVPGADIALYLARHDVKATVSTQNTGSDIGNALLSFAADRSADLIVMGGYGHSRFREILLGGVTRTIFQSMTVPVLMSN